MKNIALALLLAASSAFAQMNIATGSISGTVTDSSGQVIPSALVTLTYELNGEIRTMTTTPSGNFSFPVLWPLHATAGFKIGIWMECR